jgi:hypothetical protein
VHAKTIAYPARRFGLLAGPLFFVALSLIVLAGSRDLGTRLFYAVLTVLSGGWLVRAWRSAVILSDEAVRFRGQVRTRDFRWSEIAGASVGPMATMSPLRGRFPYVDLVIELRDGKRRAFPELAAPEHSPDSLPRIVAAEISRRAAGRMGTT